MMDKFISQAISNVAQNKIIQSLLKKKSRLKPKDPIQSNLFIICEEDSQLKKKNKAKSQRYQNKKTSPLSKFTTQKKNGTDIKNYKRNFSYSQSVQLPSIYRRFSNSNKTEIKTNRTKTIQVNNQRKYQQKINRLKSRNIIAHYTNQDQGFQQYIKKNKRLLSLHTQQLSNYKTETRHNTNNTVKFNQLNKQKNSALKIIKQWKQINILKLQTYFIKLKKSKKITNLSQSKIENNKQISHFRNYVPQQAKISEFIKNYQPTNPQINIDSLVRNQKFGVIFQNNLSLYFGEIKDGNRTGLGIYICSNFRFQGTCKNDQKVYGHEITSNGYYKGQFKNNKRHGQGQYVWQNGESYTGEWKNGVKSGSGVWKSGKGDIYVGQWTNGKVQGYGMHNNATGQRYQGQFKQFLKHGSGKQIFPNGDVYKGQYLKGYPHGKGFYTWKNNITYQGQFKNGYRDGKGILTAKNYLKYQGNFYKDLPNGEGVLTYDNGNQYTGMFKHGQKHGQGTLKLKKQRKIMTGKWQNNQFLFQQKQ